MGISFASGKTREEFLDSYHKNEAFQLQQMKIYVTRRCNLKCVMCGQGKQQTREITLAEFDSVVTQGKDLGLRKVKLFGGEPTMRKDLSEIISVLSSKNIFSSINTNGTLLNYQRVNSLLKSGLNLAIFSLDSSHAESHDKIRGVKGSFDKLLKTIRYFNALRTSNTILQLNIVVMKQNFMQLPEIFDFAGKNQIDYITLNPSTPNDYNQYRLEGSEENVSFRGMALVKDEIIKYNRVIAPSIIEKSIKYGIDFNPDNAYLFGQSEKEIEYAQDCSYVKKFMNNTQCLKGFFYLILNGKGEYTGCNRAKSSKYHPLGNVREHLLKDIWFSKQYNDFRYEAKTHPYIECQGCCFPFMLSMNEFCKEHLI